MFERRVALTEPSNNYMYSLTYKHNTIILQNYTVIHWTDADGNYQPISFYKGLIWT